MCSLVFVPPNFYLSPDQEKAEYDLHQNNPDDDGYRLFLSRLSQPLIAELQSLAITRAESLKGLDFGCGPGPTLHQVMADAGFPQALYDPFYYPNAEVLKGSYDFITLTEVIEHIHQPSEVITRLWQGIKPSGVMAVMTKLVIDKAAFATWHYKNDPTHVCFYSKQSFSYLANELNARVVFVDKDVIFLKSCKA